MNILSAEQIREWDQYTIHHEPVTSINLMERAAATCVQWLRLHFTSHAHFRIFCGKGNNGGDGLAIARMLYQDGYPVTVYILENESRGSADFITNLERLKQYTSAIFMIGNYEQFPNSDPDDVIIDAIFGTGLNHPLSGLAASLVQHINEAYATVISIDMPSGMFADRSSLGYTMIRATHTLTFQCYKKALLVQENGSYCGLVHVLDIGLHPDFISETPVNDFYVVDRVAKSIYKPRDRFAHKGNFGHALLLAGSYGKMGAAVLAAKACIRSGTGLLTVYIPRCGYQVLQTTVPEAMVITDADENIITGSPDSMVKYSTAAIGPGMGTSRLTIHMMEDLFNKASFPLVVDADALNAMAIKPELLSRLPARSILTPHPREFDRMFGAHRSDFDRIETALQKARDLNCILVLKGHHSMICTPEGNCWFNSTGNAGMAKGGSGDVLTGIITALLAQHYQSAHAAILGVYLHALAGDFAADRFSKEAMTASDIIKCLSQAFLQFKYGNDTFEP